MKQKASDTRTTLLQAALACFAEHGYEGASMRMIAARAQRPLSLLSHYFGNKEGLYLEVFKVLFEMTLLNNRQNPLPAGGYGPRDKHEALRVLREQIHFLYGDVIRHSDHQDPLREWGSQLWLREIRSPRPGLLSMVPFHAAPMTETLKQCIQILRPDLGDSEVAFLGSSLLGMVVGHGLMLGLNQVIWGDTKPLENQFQACEWLVELCFNGLLGSARPD